MKRKSRKHNTPWEGWSKLAPNTRERRKILKKCGRKCFLGPISQPLSFPICAKNTCKINRKGVYAAIRQLQSRITLKSFTTPRTVDKRLS